ncbi:MAG: Crp/Fnr family transcriptional regulator [Cytophagales bacterium]|nr:Crp/Fnr family transcriptional regulator [Cytophagales bacterium]
MNTPEAIAALKKLVEGIGPLPAEDWEAFAAIWQPCTARRKQVLTLAGDRERYLYFTVKGVQRVYYFDEQGREATLVFTYPPSFGGVLDALLLQTPARYHYETLTQSDFLRAPYGDLAALMQSRPAVQAMIRQGITHALSGLLERLVELQCYSSEEKFRKLLGRSPHILQLVPQKYLANYLGIEATNFSKLLHKVKL